MCFLARFLAAGQAAGSNSTAQSFIDKGVDCVIATKVQVPIIFLVFYNRMLSEMINHKSNKDKDFGHIAETAYDETIKLMVNIFKEADNTVELLDLFTPSSLVMGNYDQMLTVLGNEDLKPFPARYGETD
jgi:hypothetical protein